MEGRGTLVSGQQVDLSYKYPKRDPDWGYGTYNSMKQLLSNSPDAPSKQGQVGFTP